jgi:hypothetical protein
VSPGEQARRDRRLLVLGALLVSALFLGLGLHYTGGEIVLPLDDAYIYAQYARGLAEGHAFRYTPGDEPSTGCTGLLYPFLLAPFYLAGLRGAALPVFMALLGALLLAGSAVLVYELAGGPQERRRPTALLASWLAVLSGPLAWGFLSGMEVGLFVTLWLGLGVLLLHEGRRGRDRWSLLLASLLALVRPEGLLWSGLLWLLLPFTPERRSRARRTRLWWLLPIGVGLLPLLLNLLLTGSPAPAAGRPKSLLYLPGHHLPTMLQHAVGFLVAVVKSLLSGTGGPEITGALNRLDLWALVAPFTLVLLIFGAGPALVRSVRSREVEPATLWSVWLLAVTLWVAVTTGSSAHHFRYLLIAWPALLLLSAEGVSFLARTLVPQPESVARRTIFRSVAGFLLGFGLLSVASFALLYGQEAHGFARQYLDTARWIDRNLPAGARVASLDAGILAYAGNRRFFDLFGLTTPVMLSSTAFYAEDAGSKYEIMEGLPAEERPTHFVLHDRRYDFGGRNPYAALVPTDSLGRPRILHRAGVDIDVPVVGANLLVWPADWSGAGAGEAPCGPASGTVVARIDVADPASEREHALGLRPFAPGFLGDNRIDRLRCGARPVTDGGRGLAGSLSFRLRGLQPGRGLSLRLRTLPSPVPVPLRVEVEGRRAGTWLLPSGEAGSWAEAEFRIPEEMADSEELAVTLSGRFVAHHLWVLQ